MTANVSIFYQSSGMTPSKVYYSNTRYHFSMNSALFPLRPILHLTKNPKCNTKGVYFSTKKIKVICQYCIRTQNLLNHKSIAVIYCISSAWIEPKKKSITVIQDISSI